MQQRSIPRLGIVTSRLGFGAMRLPVQNGKIDEARARSMIDVLFKSGVTYYDTAWFYHGGTSETFLREALVRRYPRDSFTVATKLPMECCQTPDDMTRIFETQRKNLGVSTIDFYLLHGIGTDGWQKAKEFGAPAYLRRLKEEGKIRFIGFSFHDENKAFEPILDAFDWEFCQIQLNYADWHQRGAKDLYEALVRRDLPVIVMEPVRGGGLTQLRSDMQALLDTQDPTVSPAAWALRFCAELPHVDIVLSGMSSVAQCEENIALFSDPHPLSASERETLREIAQAFDRLPVIPCTHCRYCADCPQGIDISLLFERYNRHMRYQDSWGLFHEYRTEIPDEHKAIACTRCGRCESACPQRISVMDEIARVHQVAEKLWES